MIPKDPIHSGTFFKATGAASRPPAARGKGRTRRRDGFLIDAGTRGRGPAETPLAVRSNAGDHMIPSTLPAAPPLQGPGPLPITRGRGPAETPLAARSTAADHMIPSTLPAGNAPPLPHMLVQGNDDEDAIALQSPPKALWLLLSWTHHL